MDGFIHDAGAFIARNGAWAGPLLGLLTFGNPWCWSARSCPPPP
jgi:hypothetical protein